ncbi:hypothetical protein B484DRAFT_433705, partial [Ochromonadaceae sp. CCMP2298]
MNLAPTLLPLQLGAEEVVKHIVEVLNEHNVAKFPAGKPRFDTPAHFERVSDLFRGLESESDLWTVLGIILRSAQPSELHPLGLAFQMGGKRREVNVLSAYCGVSLAVQQLWVERIAAAYAPTPALSGKKRDKENMDPQGAPPAKKVRKEPHMKTPKMLSKCAKELTMQINGHLEEVAKTNE